MILVIIISSRNWVSLTLKQLKALLILIDPSDEFCSIPKIPVFTFFIKSPEVIVHTWDSI